MHQNNDTMDITRITSLIDAFRAEARQNTISPEILGNLLQKIVNLLRLAASSQEIQKVMEGKKPFYHIQCDSDGHRLKVKYPSEVIRAGYVPYLVRWTNKRPRFRDIDDHTHKWHGPRRRGWHLYGDENSIRVSYTGLVTFGFNVGTQQQPIYQYVDNKDAALPHIRSDYNARGEFLCFRVGFGGKTYKVRKNHRFRFGIVFGPPLPSGGNRSLDFSKCVTNIAEFFICFKVNQDEPGNEYYNLSYSI